MSASAHRSTTTAGPRGRSLAAAKRPAGLAGRPDGERDLGHPLAGLVAAHRHGDRDGAGRGRHLDLRRVDASSSPPSDHTTSVTRLASLCPRTRPAAPGTSVRRVARSIRMGSRCWPAGRGLGGGTKIRCCCRRIISRTTSGGPWSAGRSIGGSGIHGSATLDARFESTHSCPSVLRAPCNANRTTAPCQGTPRSGAGRAHGGSGQRSAPPGCDPLTRTEATGAPRPGRVMVRPFRAARCRHGRSRPRRRRCGRQPRPPGGAGPGPGPPARAAGPTPGPPRWSAPGPARRRPVGGRPRAPRRRGPRGGARRPRRGIGRSTPGPAAGSRRTRSVRPGSGRRPRPDRRPPWPAAHAPA